MSGEGATLFPGRVNMMHQNGRDWNRARRAELIICLFTIVLSTGWMTAQDHDEYESVSGLWQHSLSATRLAGYKNNERLIVSNIWTGVLGRDAMVKHSLKVKVDTWARKFATTYVSPDKKNKETLSVTLYKTTNSQEMSAYFEHIVYEKGQVKLRFCGVTRLTRF